MQPGFPDELKTMIEHLIISHHGQYDFGSPKLPMFPEALMLHYLDDLDSKMEAMRAMFEREVRYRQSMDQLQRLPGPPPPQHRKIPRPRKSRSPGRSRRGPRRRTRAGILPSPLPACPASNPAGNPAFSLCPLYSPWL